MGLHTWFFKPGYKTMVQGDDDPLRRRINNRWFVEAWRPHAIISDGVLVDYYHDLFRSPLNDYDQAPLTSKRECLAYIRKHKIKDVDWKSLNEFWELNPEGIITFG